MRRDERLRRVALLCLHCLRNVAFYRAGWRRKRIRIKHQFWVGANSNFIDVAVLDWCKLFADHKSKHHWKRIVLDRAKFMGKLLSALDTTEDDFRKYLLSVKRYRDKFVAHLDDDREMFPPILRPMRKSVRYFYEYLLNDPLAAKYLTDAPESAKTFYSHFYEVTTEQYRAADELDGAT